MSELLKGHRIVPVVVLSDAHDAAPLANALLEGGLPVAEVTFRTAAAEDALREMASDPRMFVGAGTVVLPDQVDRAVRAGAKFIVSPGLNPAVVRRCRELGVPALPGVATASDIMLALDLGLGLLKFFPAEQLGGVSMLKALAAPFGSVSFVPTGGIDAQSAPGYFSLPSVAAIGGSWMVKADLVRAGAFDRIRQLTAEAVALASGGTNATA